MITSRMFYILNRHQENVDLTANTTQNPSPRDGVEVETSIAAKARVPARLQQRRPISTSNGAWDRRAAARPAKTWWYRCDVCVVQCRPSQMGRLESLLSTDGEDQPQSGASHLNAHRGEGDRMDE
jgi:hypothetical protein